MDRRRSRTRRRRRLRSALKALGGGHAVTVATRAETPLAHLRRRQPDRRARRRRSPAPTPRRAQIGVVRALDAQGRAIGEAPFDFGAGLTAEATFRTAGRVAQRHRAARHRRRTRRRARPGWSTSAGGAGASRSSRAPAPTSPSPCFRPSITSSGRWSRSPKSASRQAGRGRPDRRLARRKALGARARRHERRRPGRCTTRWPISSRPGGVLIRFAGARLAAGDDDLTPTACGAAAARSAARCRGRRPSTSRRSRRRARSSASPRRTRSRCRARCSPSPSRASPTRPGRGSPTARRWSPPTRRGKGLIVLFHVTGDTTWSNLPLSGPVRRDAARASWRTPTRRRRADRGPARRIRPRRCRPTARSTASARSARRPPTAEPIPARFAGTADAEHPPGFYGAARSARARSTRWRSATTLAPADYAGLQRRAGGLETAPPIDLKPWLLLAAFLGFLADTLASLWLSAPRAFCRGARAALIGAASSPAPVAARAPAQPRSRPGRRRCRRASAYVVTGDAEVDETSRLGLVRLAQALGAAHFGRARRTRGARSRRATSWLSIR